MLTKMTAWTKKNDGRGNFTYCNPKHFETNLTSYLVKERDSEISKVVYEMATCQDLCAESVVCVGTLDYPEPSKIMNISYKERFFGRNLYKMEH